MRAFYKFFSATKPNKWEINKTDTRSAYRSFGVIFPRCERRLG